jgi:predicted DNA-binding ribbon-helix-helix protein
MHLIDGLADQITSKSFLQRLFVFSITRIAYPRAHRIAAVLKKVRKDCRMATKNFGSHLKVLALPPN